MNARVGLDTRLTRRMSVGMKIYARELAARLPRVAPEFEFVPFSDGENFGIDEHVRLPLAMRRAHLDLIHFLSVYAPVPAPRPYVITIHDLIHLQFPQQFKRRVGPYYRTVVRLACARAARVITDDERTVEDLRRYLGVDPARVCVIPLGVDEAFLGAIEPYRAPRPYVLYAGNHRAHKDLATLVEMWRGLPPECALDLYVTGVDDFGAARSGSEHRRMVALGDLSAAALGSYYAGAQALVHPALREGFGLTMLEAMAARCPVIACADAVPKALLPATLTFAPRDSAAARSHLLEVLKNDARRQELVASGRLLAEKLTWDRCAAATAGVYLQVLEESR